MEDSGQKGTILVVDDSPLILGLVQEALEASGYRVLTTSSWVEVNVLLKETPPDLVLMDVQMPTIRGENFCRILKSSEHFSAIPVVLFSSLEPGDLAELAEESGADGWIHKRLRPQEIQEDVEREFLRLLGGQEGSGAAPEGS